MHFLNDSFQQEIKKGCKYKQDVKYFVQFYIPHDYDHLAIETRFDVLNH